MHKPQKLTTPGKTEQENRLTFVSVMLLIVCRYMQESRHDCCTHHARDYPTMCMINLINEKSNVDTVRWLVSQIYNNSNNRFSPNKMSNYHIYLNVVTAQRYLHNIRKFILQVTYFTAFDIDTLTLCSCICKFITHIHSTLAVLN